jgi:hypothetical protein
MRKLRCGAPLQREGPVWADSDDDIMGGLRTFFAIANLMGACCVSGYSEGSEIVLPFCAAASDQNPRPTSLSPMRMVPVRLGAGLGKPKRGERVPKLTVTAKAKG